MKRRKSKTTRAVPKVFIIAMIVFAAGTIFFGWKVADHLIDAHRSQDFWDDLRKTAIITSEATGEEMRDGVTLELDEGNGDGVPALIDFTRIHALSEDAAAWIYSPGTIINYMVARGEDNEYYLHHLVNGAYANGGTPFMDYRCAADFSDWNTVIYGHNMNNGTMFAELTNYSDQAYFEEHPVMYLYVPGKRYKLELIAGYTAKAADRIYSVPITKEERDELLSYAEEKSTFDSGISAGAEEKLVTLSTCSDASGVARYVVIARIAEIRSFEEGKTALRSPEQ